MLAENLMNRLQSAVLSLYNYDETPDETDVYQTLLKGINLIAKYPALGCYSYQAKMHDLHHGSLIIHYPRTDYSIAENILYMLRLDGRFSQREASLLDAILVIHADHGGGNNSTFTDVVIGSTGTDLYSAICGSVGSLKGPKHGGANISVSEMMNEVIERTQYYRDEEQIRSIVNDLLDKKMYDRSGLIYGFGHAVYTLSDPRAELLRSLCRQLAEEKGKIVAVTYGFSGFPMLKQMRAMIRDGAVGKVNMVELRYTSPSPASRAGWLTMWRTSSMTEESCARPPSTSASVKSIFR